jgi:hypothetical protein
MASEGSSNVAMHNIGLWRLLEGISDESDLTSEVGRINEIRMGQNGQQRDTLAIQKGLNKSHVDSLGRDKGVRVAAIVIGWLNRQSEIVNGRYRKGTRIKLYLQIRSWNQAHDLNYTCKFFSQAIMKSEDTDSVKPLSLSSHKADGLPSDSESLSKRYKRH